MGDKYIGPERRQNHDCGQTERIARIEGNVLDSASAIAVLQEQSHETSDTVKATYKKLFVDNGVDSFQTMFRKGTARMDAQDKLIFDLNSKMIAHEERPKKILGFCAVVVPLVIGVGAAVYHVVTWIIDHFKWS